MFPKHLAAQYVLTNEISALWFITQFAHNPNSFGQVTLPWTQLSPSEIEVGAYNTRSVKYFIQFFCSFLQFSSQNDKNLAMVYIGNIILTMYLVTPSKKGYDKA